MADSEQPISYAYSSDGVSVGFAFPSYFTTQGALVVTFKDSTGAVTTKVLGSDYTISGVVDTHLNTYKDGGTVVFGVAPAAGGQVRVTRRTARTQPAVFTPADPFASGSLEATLDRAMNVIQEIASGFLGIGDGPPATGTEGQWMMNANWTPGGNFGWVNIGGSFYEFGPISTGPI